jgi:hypothetical protein
MESEGHEFVTGCLAGGQPAQLRETVHCANPILTASIASIFLPDLLPDGSNGGRCTHFTR